MDAVVSTEDRHFFSEGALNPVSIVRAASSDLSGSGSLQGASTITQQYVKQTYLTSQRSITRKLKEAALAIRISRSESKDQILQGYLNTIYWGRGAYGIEAASQAYFGKSVSQLGLPEASLLAGLIREPVLADPARNPELARQNQSDTLKALVRDKKITETQAQAVQALPFSKYVVSPSSIQRSGHLKRRRRVLHLRRAPGAVRQVRTAGWSTAGACGSPPPSTRTCRPRPTTPCTARTPTPSTRPPASRRVLWCRSMTTGRSRPWSGGQNYSTSTVDLALGTAGGGSGQAGRLDLQGLHAR